MIDKGIGSVLRILLLCILLIFILGYIVLFCWNSFELKIDLEGEEEIYLEYGDIYIEPGSKVRIFGTKLIKNGKILDIPIHIESKVVADRLGRFEVNYSAEYHGFKADNQRIVWIVDTVGPTIELFSYPDDPLPIGTPYAEKGYRAMDNYDGDITHRVVCTEENGVITYGVADSSGNPCYVQRVLEYIDYDYPELTMNGENIITLYAGDIFTDPGCTAWDKTDGDITEIIDTDGEVLWYIPGTYSLTYTVCDSFGNSTSAVREVEVLSVEQKEVVYPRDKTIYLTFDDGPGIHTLHLLDVLDDYGVKATFFVVNSNQNYILREIVRRGHSIGIHSMSHSYNDIYASPEAYFADMYEMQNLIENVTGVHTTLLRFPGGGSNTISCSNPGIMTTLTEAVQYAGFQYFDWNVDSNDAGGAKTKDTVLNNMIHGIKMHDVSIVLQHDIHAYSVDAVEELIIWGMENGYQFLPLDSTSPAFHHDVRN